MTTELISAADIRTAMKALEEAPLRVCWPHVVHPKYAEWEVVWSDLRGDEIFVPCAMLCGGGLVFRQREVAP